MIDIKGLGDLQSKLNSLQVKVQKTIVKDALKQTNQEIVLPAVAANTPVDSGALKDGLSVKSAGGRGKIGSRVSLVGKKGENFYGNFVELGTKNIAPRKFMRAALDDNELIIIKTAGEKIGAGIEDACK